MQDHCAYIRIFACTVPEVATVYIILYTKKKNCRVNKMRQRRRRRLHRGIDLL